MQLDDFFIYLFCFCLLVGSCCFTSLKDIKEGEHLNLNCQVDCFWSYLSFYGLLTLFLIFYRSSRLFTFPRTIKIGVTSSFGMELRCQRAVSW